MTTPGERLSQRLTVEAPDICSDSCSRFADFLLDVTSQVDTGEMNPDEAFSPLAALVKACPFAVEAGGQASITAARARSEINSLMLSKIGEGPPCGLSTTAVSHALMYARGEDPYFGDLDFDDGDDEPIIYDNDPNDN